MNKILFLIFFLISSCAMQPIPSDKYYQLTNLGNEYETNFFQINKTFKIKKTKSQGVFNSQEILFFDQNSFQKYDYFLWVDRPSNMIDHIFKEKIKNSNFFEDRLINHDDRIKSDYIIKLTLFEIYQGIKNNGSKVALAIELYDNKKNQTIFSDYQTSEFLSDDDVLSFVNLLNLEINRILDQFIIDLINMYN